MSNYFDRGWPAPAPSGPPSRVVVGAAVLVTLVVLAVVVLIVVGASLDPGAAGDCGGG